MKTTVKTNVLDNNKVFVWITGLTALLLSIPLFAMRYSTEIDWSPADFVMMGTLIFVVASLFVLTARRVKKNRAVLALVFMAVFLYIWAELAVGIFTNLGS